LNQFSPNRIRRVVINFQSMERAIGLLLIFPVRGIIGPNLGLDCKSIFPAYIFYINLPIGVGLIALIVVLLEDSKIISRPHIDFVGASFFFGAILFLMLGLNFVAENFSITSLLLTVLFLIVSLSFLYLFSRHEKKDSNPILDMALLRSKPFCNKLV
jgi:MFS family permease